MSEVDQPPPARAVGRLDLRRGAPVLLVGAVLAVAVHLWGLYRVTGPPSPPWFPNADKLEHVLGFGLPVLLILLAVHAYRQRHAARLTSGVITAVVALFAAHAVVSEVVQHLAYTSRSGDWRDALADLTGVALGAGLARWLVRR